MEFKFVMHYDQKAITAMVKGLRKTVRKKQDRRSRIFAMILIALTLLLTFFPSDDGFQLEARTILNIAICIILILVLLFQDQINALIAKKRSVPGVDTTTVTFREDGYYSETAVGNTEWGYGKITALAESPDYFIFIIGNNHGQVYDKSSIVGGTADEFRVFIEEKMGMKTVPIK